MIEYELVAPDNPLLRLERLIKNYFPYCRCNVAVSAEIYREQNPEMPAKLGPGHDISNVLICPHCKFSKVLFDLRLVLECNVAYVLRPEGG